MRYWAIILVLLAGCDTPSRTYRDVPVSRISVDQSVFDIRVKDNRAEAIRINAEWAPRLSSVKPRAIAAIEQVSGCKVKRMRGDQAMMIADLKCKGSPVPQPPKQLSCEMHATPLVGSDSELSYDIDCVEVST